MRSLFCAFFFSLLLFTSAFSSDIWVLNLKGVVNPPMAHYIVSNLQKAQYYKANLIIITIDTPGGLDASMREIIKAIISSSTPVITFVYPSGARAASAGLYITIAGSLAAMAPGTNIGAAHPVSLGVKMDKTMMKKITNDAWAYLKSVSKMRNHFNPWLEKAVKESESIDASGALKLRIIDIVASDIPSLINKLKENKSFVAKLGLALPIVPYNIKFIQPSFRDKLLYLISQPNVAYILAVLGFYGLLFELSNPGLIFPGVVGVVFLVLSFYAFHTLPINYAAALLILFGLFLMLLDIKIPSHGLLSIAGVVCFILGSSMLVESPAPYLKLSFKLILPIGIVTALFIGILVALGIKSQLKRTVTGLESMIGEKGKSITHIDKNGGRVFVHGEIWKAISDYPIPPDTPVKVKGADGLMLKVEACDEQSTSESAR